MQATTGPIPVNVERSKDPDSLRDPTFVHHRDAEVLGELH